MQAFQIPQLICGHCGWFMAGVLTTENQKAAHSSRAPRKNAFKCTNGSCRHFDQPHWFYFQEHSLDEKVAPDELV